MSSIVGGEDLERWEAMRKVSIMFFKSTMLL